MAYGLSKLVCGPSWSSLHKILLSVEELLRVSPRRIVKGAPASWCGNLKSYVFPLRITTIRDRMLNNLATYHNVVLSKRSGFSHVPCRSSSVTCGL